MAKQKELDELIGVINNSKKTGVYALDSYRPDRTRFYRLSEMTADEKHLKIITGFMTSREMKRFLEGFITGIDII